MVSVLSRETLQQAKENVTDKVSEITLAMGKSCQLLKYIGSVIAEPAVLSNTYIALHQLHYLLPFFYKNMAYLVRVLQRLRSKSRTFRTAWLHVFRNNPPNRLFFIPVNIDDSVLFSAKDVLQIFS